MFEGHLQELRDHHLFRELHPLASATGPTITLHGRSVILLSSNNYLGLATHPSVIEAAVETTKRYGAGAGASRLVCGTLPSHQALETALAEFKGTEAALSFGSGYLANIGVIPTLIGKTDLIFADRLCHASLIEGCRLSGATLRIYRHCDMNHLEQLLAKRSPAKPTLIVTDGLFSMDGDIAPLADLTRLAKRYGANVYVDDAHGTGILGSTGRGTLEHCGVESSLPYHMGTLSKAIGSVGGYLAGSRSFIDYLINTCRAFIYTTASPPASAAAATAALRIIQEEPARRIRLWENRNRLVQALTSLGFQLGPSASPILPIIVGAPERAIRLAQTLLTFGVYAPAIRPPTVPPATSRIRLTVTADHTAEQLDEVVSALERAGQALRLI
ncbi:8-amino-7-oxononanoate synthase [Nitrospirales bacterium NOB]|nr:8-amino-7-oxononanoate synthase [Nitrospirota bacterium]MCK6492374.1 8-amino-7-oxononanoate synthase [Nitrospira sp.]MDL1888503.1 8-amino-7-oxononanoate synthase [Nitrospirales bacterium NOB]MEB2338097.1 8-amino-7-oxononanoate synthase [Nitrospirales bacterium]QOJ37240.1 MAG: 8-amino-7-oxononanoate synthase [Nitrospira sp.]